MTSVIVKSWYRGLPLYWCSHQIMAGRRLSFNDLSDFEDDSHQGSSSKRGVGPNIDIDATNRRASEATQPLDFEDELVMATIESIRRAGLVVAS